MTASQPNLLLELVGGVVALVFTTGVIAVPLDRRVPQQVIPRRNRERSAYAVNSRLLSPQRRVGTAGIWRGFTRAPALRLPWPSPSVTA
jgi:hypothetical protein